MEKAAEPMGRYARLGEASNGKDTMTGHWEMMGIKTEKPFITFTEHGFPPEAYNWKPGYTHNDSYSDIHPGIP